MTRAGEKNLGGKTHACRPALPQSSPLVRKQVVGYFDCGEDFAIRSSARLTRSRTGEGRKRAQDRGVRFGRPPKLTPHQRAEALARLAAGETQADVARTYGVDATTIGRL
jgi:hypothetical protein